MLLVPSTPPTVATEPVLLSTGLYTLLAAVVGVLTAFSVWHPSDAQVAAIATIFAAVTPFLGFFVRSKVVPVAKVAVQVQQALYTPVPTAPAVPTVAPVV